MNILEQIKNGKKVQTRDGKTVRILCTNLRRTKFPIVAAVDYDECEEVHLYHKDGQLISGCDNNSDLIIVPDKVVKYFNIFKTKKGIELGSDLYDTEEAAVKAKSCYSTYLTTKSFEIEL